MSPTPTRRVRLSEAAHALLETDRAELNLERRIECDGLFVIGLPTSLASLKDKFADYVSGVADADNPGAAKRTALAAMAAIDRVLAS